MSGTEPTPELQPASIAASTEREAMDWSLVLLSQGIEPTLARDPDTGNWQLVVSPDSLEAGRNSIRLYEEENRAWPLRLTLPWPGFAFDWTVLAWAGLLAVFFTLQGQPGSALDSAGVCAGGFVRAGQWWRLITATFLHADLGHLASNAVFGVLLLGLAMGRFGAGVGLLVAHLAGALGNTFALLWRDDRVSSLGASGVVMAALGLLAADGTVMQLRHRQPRRLIIGALACGMMLFLFLGVAPGSDIAAHFGGFLAGLLLGLPLAVLPFTCIRDGRLNWFSGAILTALVVTAWWLALRR